MHTKEHGWKLDIYTNIPSERFLLRPFVAASAGDPVPLMGAQSVDSAAAAAPYTHRHTNITIASCSFN